MGVPLEDVKTTFKRPILHLVHPKPNVDVIPGGICPGCIFRIPRIPPIVDPKMNYGVIIGTRVKFPKDRDFDEIWCFGDCGIKEGKKIITKFPHLEKKLKMVKGCPPLDWWCEHTIKKELKERGWME